MESLRNVHEVHIQKPKYIFLKVNPGLSGGPETHLPKQGQVHPV